MNWPHAYTPLIWPVVTSIVFFAVLGAYSLRQRTVPGAVFFALLVAFSLLWLFGEGFRITGTSPQIRIFWYKFQQTLMIPIVTLGFCFAVDYAGLGKRLTPRMLALLAVVPSAVALLVLTNQMHHLIWAPLSSDVVSLADLGPFHCMAGVYAYFLSLWHLMVLGWLFWRSPRHRWIAAGLILAPLSVRAGTLLQYNFPNPLAPLNAIVLFANFAILPYALAIFRFRMFDVIPVARDTVIEQMVQGMVVVDRENRVADVNAAAQSILGIERSRVVGTRVEDVLGRHPGLSTIWSDSDLMPGEVFLKNPHTRWFDVTMSPLIDRRGFQIGRLIWFRDIDEQKRAWAKILDQQKCLAIFNERELLARELHDGIGQMLAAAQMQTRVAAELLAKGEAAAVAVCLRHLADLTQEAKDAVRRYLQGVQAGMPGGEGLLEALGRYLKRYSRDCGIRTELFVSAEFKAERIEAAVEAQLQLIVQEALTNTRRHGQASTAWVMLDSCDGQVCVTVEDDGFGFDSQTTAEPEGFGLRSMRGRAEVTGGFLEIDAVPGHGTRVTVRVPRRKEGA
jgi:PAS domain S-box-containing protein